MALQRAVVSATQGGADAFVEAQLLTNLENTSFAYAIRGIEWEFPNIDALSAATLTDANFVFTITRRSKAAIPQISDLDVMFKQAVIINAHTAAGYMYLPGLSGYHLVPEVSELIAPENVLYLQLDSTSTGLANKVNVALDYDLVRISEVDRLTILARSLTN